MPGWYEATRELREAGKIAMVGVIQEQHPERCALFMQWKQMDFPILIDSLNLLEISAVPVYVLIDEHGVVREINPRGVEAVKAFVEREFEEPTQSSNNDASNPDELERRRALAAHRFREFQSSNDESKSDLLDIPLFEEVLAEKPDHGPTNFRLGVAYRTRFDSEYAQPRDFQKAIDHWLAAREADPNQYIWRRRLQQYGPRLDKPYPFYDWVEPARAEIRARGEEPVQLRIEPRGSELAGASRDFTIEAAIAESPDPAGRITRDSEFISVSTVIVPHTDAAKVRGSSARVYLTFVPNRDRDAHWNNESEPMIVWINPIEGWDFSQRFFTIANHETAVSDQTRVIEFEIRPMNDAGDDAGQIPVPSPPITGFALYNVCEGETGACLYRRLDFDGP